MTPQVVCLSTELTDHDLREMMRTLFSIVSQNKNGFILTISGYDDDPRELWQIPEAIKLCERLVATGLIGVLEVSTGIKELTTCEDYARLGFGSFEVWMVATKQVATGSNEINRTTIRKFLGVLQEATNKCIEFCQGNQSKPMEWRTTNGQITRIDDRLV
jgi:hypothetical protein